MTSPVSTWNETNIAPATAEATEAVDAVTTPTECDALASRARYFLLLERACSDFHGSMALLLQTLQVGSKEANMLWLKCTRLSRFHVAWKRYLLARVKKSR